MFSVLVIRLRSLRLLRVRTENIRSEERFSRNAETDLVCRLLLEKKHSSIRLRIRPLRSRLAPPRSIPQGLLRNKFDERREANSSGARRNRNRQIRLFDPHLRLQKRAG